MPISRLLHHLYTEEEFIFSVLTDGAGQTFALPLEATGTYSFQVAWGDGNTDEISVWNDAAVTHTYTNAGTYTIVISGTIIGFRFNNGGDDTKMRDIKNWGPLRLGNNNGYFHGCRYLGVTATDMLDLTGTTDLSHAFRDTYYRLTDIPNINSWDVSNVTNLFQTFCRAYRFDSPLSNWDTSSCTNMAGMFNSAKVFNHSIDAWDTSKVTTLQGIFVNAYLFNQPLNSWDVSHVTDMYHTFNQANAFNQPLNSWDTSAVTDMDGLFWGADAFNQSVDAWDVSAVTTMAGMFGWTNSFNQPLNSWDTSAVTDMGSLFSHAIAFNQPLSAWNTAAVTDMAGMFADAALFNRDLSAWNTAAVTNMGWMFDSSDYALVFDQNVSAWVIISVTDMEDMFANVTLSTANYDALLIGWEGQAVSNNVTFSGGNSKYSAGAAATARQALIDDHSWNITDGGQV